MRLVNTVKMLIANLSHKEDGLETLNQIKIIKKMIYSMIKIKQTRITLII